MHSPSLETKKPGLRAEEALPISLRAARPSLVHRFGDMLFLLRPVLLGPVWTIYGVGALRAGGRPGWDLAFVSLLVGGVYVHNQLMDVETDRANGKLFLLGDGHVSRSAAWAIAALTWVAALAWAATEGARFWLYLVAFALGLAYNGRPAGGASAGGWSCGWKARPWAGLAANVLAHGPVTFLAGWTAAGGAWSAGMVAALPYGTAVGAVYLATTIVDRSGDLSAGKVTWAVRYGPGRTAQMIGALVCTSAVAAALLGDWWMAAASALAIPWAVALVHNPVPEAAQRVAKLAVTVLACAVALRWPPLFALAALTFVGARLYYRRRFGVRYPNFGPD